MERQLFVVTLEVPSAVSHGFPRVEAERMANIIRDAVQAKSRSFTGPVPFKITVERVDEAASASGEMREYRAEEFPEIEEAVREQSETVEKVVTGTIAIIDYGAGNLRSVRHH